MNSTPFRKDTELKLSKTPEGVALRDLIKTYGYDGLALELGVSRALVRLWASDGKMSRHGARLAEERLRVAKEAIRPDVKIEDWDQADRGLKIGAQPEHTGEHSRLLADLAQHFGGAPSFSARMAIPNALFHKWKNRNKIPASALARIAVWRSKLPTDLRKRVEAAIKGDA